MKWIKRILIILVTLIVLALIVAFFLPSKSSVERSVVINAKTDKIMSQIIDLKKWDFWSPWKLDDTAAKYTYNDTVGIGAFMEWKGEMVGHGNLRITAIEPGKSITYILSFIKPFKSKSTGMFAFDSTPEGVKVTWKNEMALAWPISRWMGVFIDFDKQMGPDFEKGLTLLRNHVETMHEYTYTILEKNVEAQTIAGIRAKIHKGDISKILGANYGAIMAYVSKNGAKCIGPPMAITMAWDSLTWDFIAAMPIDKEIPSQDKIKVEKSYAGKAIYVEYKGAYDKTYTAYMDMGAYVKEHNLTEAGGPWEVYVTDPATEPDTSKWITEIYFPVK